MEAADAEGADLREEEKEGGRGLHGQVNEACFGTGGQLYPAPVSALSLDYLLLAHGVVDADESVEDDADIPQEVFRRHCDHSRRWVNG